jgi:hypothetical protein
MLVTGIVPGFSLPLFGLMPVIIGASLLNDNSKTAAGLLSKLRCVRCAAITGLVKALVIFVLGLAGSLWMITGPLAFYYFGNSHFAVWGIYGILATLWPVLLYVPAFVYIIGVSGRRIRELEAEEIAQVNFVAHAV